LGEQKQINTTMGFEFKEETPIIPVVIEENLTQPVLTEEQTKEYAIQFIEETELMVKFMIWVEIQEQLKQVNLEPQG